MNKTCSKCNIEKLVSEYHKSKTSKYGVKGICKECCNKYNRKYMNNNKEKIKEYNIKNKEKFKEYRDKNKEKLKKQRKKYYTNNKEKISKKNKEYRMKNKEKIKENKKKYYKNNKKKYKEYRENYKEIFNKRRRWRTKNDIQYKLMQSVRSRLHDFLKSNNIYKNNTTIKSIGCSKQQLTNWIKYNLDLDNLKEYHIDHLKPLSSFSCKTFEEVIECKCNHYSNLIPVTPEYNIIKSNREPTKHELFKQELRLYIFNKITL